MLMIGKKLCCRRDIAYRCIADIGFIGMWGEP